MMNQKIDFEDAKNKALAFVKTNGPSIPSEVSKEISMPPLFASALLSQLISEKSLKVSNLKIGGSPLYYSPDQKEKLVNFLHKLPGAEKEVCERLKEEKILADDSLQLIQKVALRNTKDFSIPLGIKIGESTKIFWKWFLIPQHEALSIIEKFMGRRKEKEEQIEKEKPVEIKETTPVEKSNQTKKKKIKEKSGIQKQLIEVIENTEEVNEQAQEILEERKEEKEIDKGEFFDEIKKYLENNQVQIQKEKMIRKNKEFEMVLELKSSLGNMVFFAIAKNKKVISPADITYSHYRGQEKKLPLILLSSGKFTKKAEEMAAELGITLKSLKEDM